MANNYFVRPLNKCTWLFTAILAGAICSAYAAPIVQDPTRPVHFVEEKAAKAQENSLQLQAIFLSKQRAEAVINGRTLRRGDVIHQATIIAIDAGKVIYERDGQRSELFLFPRVIKPSRAEE